MTSTSTQRRVLIATLGAGSLSGLAKSLAATGASVTQLSDSPQRREQGSTAVRHVAWDPSSRASTEQNVSAAIAAAGAPDLLVVHTLPHASLTGGEAIEHDDAQWRKACGTAMLQTIHLLQSLAVPLKSQHAAIVFVGPSLSLVGCAGLAGLVTLCESQRGLVKSLARQWGKHGVTCNWVALEARELWAGLGQFKLPVRMEAIPVALGRRPDTVRDLAGVVDYLAGDAGHAMTGTTLCLDGGEWMVP
jgi:NAD(P)-dependent dehydrogenase (short-subunit alcohol dehydrogenase family)